MSIFRPVRADFQLSWLSCELACLAYLTCAQCPPARAKQSLCEALMHKISHKCTIKGNLHSYRFCDNVSRPPFPSHPSFASLAVCQLHA